MIPSVCYNCAFKHRPARKGHLGNRNEGWARQGAAHQPRRGGDGPAGLWSGHFAWCKSWNWCEIRGTTTYGDGEGADAPRAPAPGALRCPCPQRGVWRRSSTHTLTLHTREVRIWGFGGWTPGQHSPLLGVNALRVPGQELSAFNTSFLLIDFEAGFPLRFIFAKLKDSRRSSPLGQGTMLTPVSVLGLVPAQQPQWPARASSLGWNNWSEKCVRFVIPPPDQKTPNLYYFWIPWF